MLVRIILTRIETASFSSSRDYTFTLFLNPCPQDILGANLVVFRNKTLIKLCHNVLVSHLFYQKKLRLYYRINP